MKPKTYNELMHSTDFPVEICYCTKMTLSFDGTYNIEPKARRLDEAIEYARLGIKLHDFNWCDIIDSNTGEVLAIVRKAKSDDNEE